ncbi:hypothetical protein HW132_11715 [Brasilonema sp. CT11]|nr:hypothetical protein [Brasilonema sp. CT11]
MSNEILFTDLSVEEQEVAAGGAGAYISQYQNFYDNLYFNPLYISNGPNGSYLSFQGFSRNTSSNVSATANFP